MMASHFDELGGEPRLRALVDAFVDRVFADAMIGYFFARSDRQRIKDREYEFAAQHLGAKQTYSGRPIRTAHAPHAIALGHFNRRLQILKETLHDFGVPHAIAEAWLAHNRSLESTVTASSRADCEVPAQRPAAVVSQSRARSLPVSPKDRPAK
jgi:hemoglobin